MCVCGYIIHIGQFDQPSAFICQLGSWFWSWALHKFPWCNCGWVGQCCWLAVGNSVGITIDSTVSFAAGFPVPRESQKPSTAPLTLSWLTSITTVEVNGFHSFSFAFQFSSFQCAGSTEYGMSAFGKVEHHAFSNFIPFSIRFVDMSSVPFLLRSRPWKWPMSSRQSSSILCNFESIRNTIFFISSFSPITVIVHWHEDDPSFELLWFTLWFSHHLLNLVENSHCSEAYEKFPLELHRLPVDPIQIFKITCFHKPFNPPRHSTESEKT